MATFQHRIRPIWRSWSPPAPGSAERPRPGGRPDRLRLFGVIGRGGMGVVLKGLDTDLGRDLAVKVLREQFRDQPRNIQACYDKLRGMVLEVLRPPKKRRPTKPTRGSKVRRLNDKKARSQVKEGRRFRGE